MRKYHARFLEGRATRKVAWLLERSTEIPPRPGKRFVRADYWLFTWTQTKFAASLISPVPLYLANCG